MAQLAAVLLASERAGYLSLGATFLNGTPSIRLNLIRVIDSLEALDEPDAA